jgi:hypothetical protein
MEGGWLAGFKGQALYKKQRPLSLGNFPLLIEPVQTFLSNGDAQLCYSIYHLKEVRPAEFRQAPELFKEEEHLVGYGDWIKKAKTTTLGINGKILVIRDKRYNRNLL